MIILFGAAGSGKSVQGQILAARHGWRWLSAGQLLRDSRNHELLKEMSTGELVDDAKVNDIVAKALRRSHDVGHVIMDGFPRHLEQAKWLVHTQPDHGRAISLVIVLDVPKQEVVKRLRLRGRGDDTPEAIEERLEIFKDQIEPIVRYFHQQGIQVVHIDGTGTVQEVHDRIEMELQECSLV